MARQIIRNRSIVADEWTRVGDDEDLPEGKVIVSMARLLEVGDALFGGGRSLGVLIDGEDDAHDLAPWLGRLRLVAVLFPKFADGRGYSHARILRDQLGYTGELRATGDVLRDQIFYMARVGFDAFEPAPGLDPRSAVKGLDDFTVTYQAAADDHRPLFRRVEPRKSA